MLPMRKPGRLTIARESMALYEVPTDEIVSVRGVRLFRTSEQPGSEHIQKRMQRNDTTTACFLDGRTMSQSAKMMVGQCVAAWRGKDPNARGAGWHSIAAPAFRG